MVFSRHKPDAASRGGIGRSSSSSAPPQTASSGAAIDPSLNSSVSGLPQPPAYNPLVPTGAAGARASTARRGSRTSADTGGSAHGTDPSRHAVGGSDLSVGGSNLAPVSNRRGSGNMGTTSGGGSGSDRPRSRSGRGASFRGGDGGDGGGRGEGSSRPSSRAGLARGGSEDLEGGGGGGSRHDGRGAGGGGGGESGITRVPYQNRVGMECLSPINVARDGPFGGGGEYDWYRNSGAVLSVMQVL